VAFAATAAPVADLNGRPATEKQPIIVIDNYDSFTYNLCQVYTVFSFRIALVL
jgi:anthranilate synthase component 2